MITHKLIVTSFWLKLPTANGKKLIIRNSTFIIKGRNMNLECEKREKNGQIRRWHVRKRNWNSASFPPSLESGVTVWIPSLWAKEIQCSQQTLVSLGVSAIHSIHSLVTPRAVISAIALGAMNRRPFWFAHVHMHLYRSGAHTRANIRACMSASA